jgi:hypothetical protein
MKKIYHIWHFKDTQMLQKVNLEKISLIFIGIKKGIDPF